MIRHPAIRDRARVVELNDRLRTTFAGGHVQLHTGGHCLDAQLCGRALYALSRYSHFAPDDEHDFGEFRFAGFQFGWQIEYRNVDGVGWSRDPADADGTLRVLTLYVVSDTLT
jgi:hypothetical protein